MARKSGLSDLHRLFDHHILFELASADEVASTDELASVSHLKRVFYPHPDTLPSCSPACVDARARLRPPDPRVPCSSAAACRPPPLSVELAYQLNDGRRRHQAAVVPADVGRAVGPLLPDRRGSSLTPGENDVGLVSPAHASSRSGRSPAITTSIVPPPASAIDPSALATASGWRDPIGTRSASSRSAASTRPGAPVRRAEAEHRRTRRPTPPTGWRRPTGRRASRVSARHQSLCSRSLRSPGPRRGPASRWRSSWRDRARGVPGQSLRGG